MQSRTNKSIKNSSFAFFGQIIILLLQFITQTVFVRTLGAEYVGANGLFSNLLTLLSFADLGIGGAITYSLYRPLAENDKKTISAIMRLFKIAYHSIGSFIFVGGVLFSFFITHFVNSNSSIPNVQLMFVLFATNSACSYFFAYLRSLLIANQQGYVDTLNRVVFTSMQTICQIIFLITTKQYVIFLITQIFFTASSNISLQRKTMGKFPFLKQKNRYHVPKDILSHIKRNILGAIASRFGIIVTNGTDNLILSKFLGLAIVGKYTSYLLILTSAQNILNQAFNAVISSVANFSIEKSGRAEESIFYKYQYLVFGVSYVLSCTIYFILQGFIVVWIGKSYLLSKVTVLLLLILWWITINRISVQAFITAHGLYWETKWKSVCEALLNLVISLFLIMNTKLGVNSVIIGTLSSNILISLWWEPYILFKFSLKMRINKYIVSYLRQIILFTGTIGIVWLTNINRVVSGNFISLLVWIPASLLGFVAIYMIYNLFSKDQQFFIHFIFSKLKR
jgi:O-antigen/teichoic acid export membrane protein